MQTAIRTLENLFYEKILQYQDLVECLKKEHTVLIKTDMDGLWEIADEKQLIVSRIEALRSKILTALSEAAIDYPMDAVSFDLARVYSLIPSTHRERFKKPYLSLVGLKDDIQQRSQENRLFVEECLSFLDELMGIIADTGKQDAVYDNGRSSSNKKQANLLLHREV
jgi:flagellar biosynthesis/type III secretory pathway chaperone